MVSWALDGRGKFWAMASSQPSAVQGSRFCKRILDIVTSLFLVFNLSLGLLYVLNGTLSRDLKQGEAAFGHVTWR